ncbi:MAG: nitrous oxide-stimulated promoter family protein [Nitrospirota bacterium]|jgi:hypothetical protein
MDVETRPAEGRRIRREKKTMAAMVRMYCRAHHRAGAGARCVEPAFSPEACEPWQPEDAGGGEGSALCGECEEFLAYAYRRLEHCRYGGSKPACGKCPVHCYMPSMRRRAVEVMRFSGPRMSSRHPYFAFMHLLDGLRRPPTAPPSKKQ